MELVGRRLQMKWGRDSNKVVGLDKLILDQSELALLFNIYKFDNELYYRLIGAPYDFSYGRTTDWYMESCCWFTEEEYNII